MSGRTILFAYAQAPTRAALAAERPAGRLVLGTDRPDLDDGRVYDEVVELPPSWDVAGALSRLADREFDAVVAPSDLGAPLAAMLAEERGLDGPPPDAAFRAAYRPLARRALVAARVPAPRYAVASTAQDVRRFATGRYPVVLKPLAASLGHLVSQVATESAVQTASDRLLARLAFSPHVQRCVEFARAAGLEIEHDPARAFLVEEFAAGTSVEVHGFVRGGRAETFPALEQALCAPPCFFAEGHLLPAEDRGAEALARKTVAALGLDGCGFCVDVRGGVVVDVDVRLAEEDGVPALLRAATGRTPLQGVLGEAAAARHVAGGHAIAYLNAYRDGLVRAVDCLPRGVTLVAAAGRRLHAPPHPETAPHLAYALASSEHGPAAAYEQAMLRVQSVRFDVDWTA